MAESSTMHSMSANQIKTVNKPTEFHPLGASFKDLVERDFYADKSGLIEEIVSENTLSKFLLITYPPRFGKSVNLQMLTAYFQLSVDSEGNIIENKNAYLFKNLYINNVEILKNNFQGKYPVLLISFDGVKGSTFKEVRSSFISNVLRGQHTGIYVQHRYLIPLFSKKAEDKSLSEFERREYRSQLAIFRKMYDGPEEDITDGDLYNSFLYLSSNLYQEFGKRTFIFVDEYDHPLNHAWLACDDVERERIMDFFETLFHNNFKEHNPSFQQAVITGVLRYATASFTLDNIRQYNMLHNPYFKHYGLMKDDVDHLSEKIGGITEEMKVAMNSYFNGYRTAFDLECTIYNPWAITSFLETKVRAPYFEKSGIFEQFSSILHHESIRRDLQVLVDGGTISSRLDSIKMTDECFKQLLLMTNPQLKLVETDITMFYRLLLSTGYLTFDKEKNARRELSDIMHYAYLCIPNESVRMDLSQKLKDYDPHSSKSQ